MGHSISVFTLDWRSSLPAITAESDTGAPTLVPELYGRNSEENGGNIGGKGNLAMPRIDRHVEK